MSIKRAGFACLLIAFFSASALFTFDSSTYATPIRPDPELSAICDGTVPIEDLMAIGLPEQPPPVIPPDMEKICEFLEELRRNQEPEDDESPSESPSPTPSPADQVPDEEDGEALDSPAEQWSKDAGESVQKVSEIAADRYDRGFGGEWGEVAGAYSTTFALGLIVFLLVLMMLVARSAKAASNAQIKQEIEDALPRVLLYMPLTAAMPMAVATVAEGSKMVADSLVRETNESFGALLSSLGEDPGLVDLMFKPFLTVILWIVYLIGMIFWLIEDIVAEYALWLLTVLAPIAGAMSLWPSNRRMWWRLVGMIVGCALVPTVSRFAYWVMLKMSTEQMSADMGTDPMAILRIIVVIFLSISMPLMLGFVMPAVMPQGSGASDGAAGQYSAHGAAAGQGVGVGAKALVNKFQGGETQASGEVGSGSPQGAASGGGAGSAGSGSATDSSGKAGAGGKSAAKSGVGGALLMGAAVAWQAGQYVKGAARESALRSHAAAGGGQYQDAGSGSARLPRRGTGGSGSQASAAGSDAEISSPESSNAASVQRQPPEASRGSEQEGLAGQEVRRRPNGAGDSQNQTKSPDGHPTEDKFNGDDQAVPAGIQRVARNNKGEQSA